MALCEKQDGHLKTAKFVKNAEPVVLYAFFAVPFHGHYFFTNCGGGEYISAERFDLEMKHRESRRE